MIHLGGLPIVLDVFVVTVVLVRLFVCADRLVDRLLAQLHPLRLNGRRASEVLLSTYARRSSPPNADLVRPRGQQRKHA